MIYLAAPYTHKDPAVMQSRIDTAKLALICITSENITAFSPLNYFPAFSDALPEADYNFWLGCCLEVVDACETLVILPIPGWKESKGVAIEVFTAIMAGKRVGIFINDDMAAAGAIESMSEDEFTTEVQAMVNRVRAESVRSIPQSLSIIVDSTGRLLS